MLSYAHDDAALVARVADALRACGVEVWQDTSLTPFAPWDDTIARAIDAADAVVVLWTSRSVRRDWVRAEAHAARESGKIVPLLMEPCQVPLAFRLHQTADLVGWQGDLKDPNWVKVIDWIALRAGADPGRSNDLGTDGTIETSPDFAPAIRERYRQISRIVEKLTEDQFGVLRTLGTTRRVRIAGCAGSGKTLVACEKALRCAQAGLRVLFLCHSPHLARHVAGMIGAEGVQVADFSNWVSGVLGDTETPSDMQWMNIQEPETETMERAFEAILDTQNFHCVIVDEGQDFRDTWWLLVEAALQDASDSQLYIFHDDNQALLPHRAAYPFDDPVLNLSRNCRNAGRVFEAVRRFHAAAPAPETALDGQGFLAYLRSSAASSGRALDRCFRLLTEHGALHEDCVLLLAGGLEKTPMVGQALVQSGALREHWRDVVQAKLRSAVTKNVRNGILTSQADALAGFEALSGLSHEALPTAGDVALVCDIARAIRVDEQAVRRMTGGNDSALSLAWRVVDGRLRFRRSFGGRLHGVETLRFFSDPGWPAGLPAVEGWHLAEAPQAAASGRSVPVYDVSAFKGLEADTAVVLVGHHQPVRTEKLYVAFSRARLALALVDCSEGLTSFDALRKVEFDFHNVTAG